MPVESTVESLPPRKFYLNFDDITEWIIFDLQESVSQYIRDRELMIPDEFNKVYQGFDPVAILEFCRWRNFGTEDSYSETLREML